MCVSFLCCFFKFVQVFNSCDKTREIPHKHKNTTKTPSLYNDHCNHYKTCDVRQHLGDPKLGEKNEFHPHSFRQPHVMPFHVRHSF